MNKTKEEIREQILNLTNEIGFIESEKTNLEQATGVINGAILELEKAEEKIAEITQNMYKELCKIQPELNSSNHDTLEYNIVHGLYELSSYLETEISRDEQLKWHEESRWDVELSSYDWSRITNTNIPSATSRMEKDLQHSTTERTSLEQELKNMNEEPEE